MDDTVRRLIALHDEGQVKLDVGRTVADGLCVAYSALKLNKCELDKLIDERKQKTAEIYVQGGVIVGNG
jgi:hypothetical protein